MEVAGICAKEQDVAWADTVLGAVPPGTRTGTLATHANTTLVPGQTVTAVIVKGCVSPGDGGGGLFYWDANAPVGSDDGGTIIQPTPGVAGGWRRVYSGQLNVKWFGATGGGSTDDQPAIQAAINAAITLQDGTVFFPPRIYALMLTLDIPAAVTLLGSGNVAGGINASANAFPTILCMHAGNCIHFSGANGTSAASGGGVEKLRIVQVYGSLGTVYGSAIVVDCVDVDHKPGWIRFRQLQIEESDLGSWKWAISIDGTNSSSLTGQQMILDFSIVEVSTHTNSASTGACFFKACVGRVTNCDHSIQGHYSITGVPAMSGFAAMPSTVIMENVSLENLSMDYVQDCTFQGGILGGQVRTTANSHGRIFVLPGRCAALAGAVGSDASASSLGMFYYDDTAAGFLPGSFASYKPYALQNAQYLGAWDHARTAPCALIGLDANNLFRLCALGDRVIGIGSNPAATNAANGDVVMTNGTYLRWSTNTGVSEKVLGLGSNNQVVLAPDAEDIEWGKPQVALGTGATATLGRIGGGGPTTATQQDWLRVLASDGTTRWIPCWK